jgi:uncharacterized membrane protein YoaK (UPF0700 family)
MLSVTAYTLRQKARLAVSLAWIGGFVDAVGFIVLVRMFTSNMTGNTAMLGSQLVVGNFEEAFYAGYAILMFLAGAMLSGLLTIGGRRLGIKSIYSLALSVEVLLLAAFLLGTDYFIPTIRYPYLVLLALPCLAMGLQNATITQIAGAVVRTTHVTGVLTDLGLETVQFLFWFRDQTRGRIRERLLKSFYLSTRHPSLQRLLLLASIWLSFLVGALLGLWGLAHFGIACLAGPICFLMFLVILDFIRPIADIHHVDHKRNSDVELKSFGIDAEILPPNVGVYRIATHGLRRRRVPDLGRLTERIAEHFDIVLLLLPEGVELDDNNLAGLGTSLEHLRDKNRDLIVCTSESKVYNLLAASSLGRHLGPANLCSDPEFAVARAIDLAQSYTVTATIRHDNLSNIATR